MTLASCKDNKIAIVISSAPLSAKYMLLINAGITVLVDVVVFLLFSQDVNECVRLIQCSHYCLNTYGGYKCRCRIGFYLSADGHTCFGT